MFGGPPFIIISTFAKIGQTLVKIAFNGFQNGGHLPSGIFLTALGSGEPICVTMQNLV